MAYYPSSVWKLGRRQDGSEPRPPCTAFPFTTVCVAEQLQAFGCDVGGVLKTPSKGFKMILEGEVDYLPEQAFLNVRNH